MLYQELNALVKEALENDRNRDVARDLRQIRKFKVKVGIPQNCHHMCILIYMELCIMRRDIGEER